MAKTKKRQPPKSKPAFSPLLIAAVVVLSILVVAGLMLLGNPPSGGIAALEIDQFPAIGDPQAPVTIIEFSDYG